MNRRVRVRSLGMTLIEAGLAFMITAIAMVPIVSSIGQGPVMTGADGNEYNMSPAQVIKAQSREVVAANTLMEQALSGDLASSFDAATLDAGEVQETALTQFNSTYNDPIYYQWVFRDVSYKMNMDGDLLSKQDVILATGHPEAVQVMPRGNRLVQATLRVFSQMDHSNPKIVMQTYVFRNLNGVASPDKGKTGIVIVADRSGSMTQARTRWTSISGYATPYFYNRYRHFANDVPASIAVVEDAGGNDVELDLFNDSHLDLSIAAPMVDPNNIVDPNLGTPYNDYYLMGDVLGLPSDCADYGNGSNTMSSQNFSFASNNTRKRWVGDLCDPNIRTNPTQLTNTLNNYMSRMEATRSSLLAMIVQLERNPTLSNSSKLGLVTFAHDVTREVELEDAGNSPNGDLEFLRFVRMRERLAMMNRRHRFSNPSNHRAIRASGATNIGDAMKEAAIMLYEDDDITNRIILLIGDGQRTYGPSNNTIRTWADEMGDGTFLTDSGEENEGKNHTITIYTVGIINPDSNLMTDIAEGTVGGEYFYAQTVADVGPVFQRITSKLEKAILIEASQRYHLYTDQS